MGFGVCLPDQRGVNVLAGCLAVKRNTKYSPPANSFQPIATYPYRPLYAGRVTYTRNESNGNGPFHRYEHYEFIEIIDGVDFEKLDRIRSIAKDIRLNALVELAAQPVNLKFNRLLPKRFR